MEVVGQAYGNMSDYKPYCLIAILPGECGCLSIDALGTDSLSSPITELIDVINEHSKEFIIFSYKLAIKSC